MSDTTLRDLVLARLEKDTQPEDEWSALVLAALEGPDELGQLLDDGGSAPAKPLGKGAPKQPEGGGAAGTALPPTPRTAFLRSITAQAFRGIGPEALTQETPPPSDGSCTPSWRSPSR